MVKMFDGSQRSTFTSSGKLCFTRRGKLWKRSKVKQSIAKQTSSSNAGSLRQQHNVVDTPLENAQTKRNTHYRSFQWWNWRDECRYCAKHKHTKVLPNFTHFFQWAWVKWPFNGISVLCFEWNCMQHKIVITIETMMVESDKSAIITHKLCVYKCFYTLAYCFIVTIFRIIDTPQMIGFIWCPQRVQRFVSTNESKTNQKKEEECHELIRILVSFISIYRK